MATDYSKLKVTELKEILKERGIPQTGLSRKQQIVEALEKHDTDHGAENDAVEEQNAQVEDVGAEHAQEEKSAEDANEIVTAQDAKDAKDAPSIAQEEKPEPMGDAGEETSVNVDNAPLALDETHAKDEAKKEESSPIPQPLDAKPIVLENNDPVSKEPSALNTPQRASPAADSVSSDTRKRKRRSPTPPPSQESVIKKLKAANGEELVVKLPEDRLAEGDEDRQVKQDAPVAVERTAESSVDSGKLLPAASSDDIMRVDETRSEEIEEVAQQESEDNAMEVDVPSASPAIHPATRALYIRDLVRPLNANQLRSHLLKLATPSNNSLDDSIIEAFHVDTIRTHAFVVFASLAAAARTRSALHSRIWPEEPTRKPLWVDFVPDEKVADWIETEKQAEEGQGRAAVRRWEVVYEDGEDGTVARFEEASSMPPGPVRQQSTSSATGQGMGMPNAPLGPRGSRRPSIPSRPSASSETITKPTPPPAPPSASFNVLDERFSHTTAKPKLYYLPKKPHIVSSRLESLAAITSRDWDPEKEGSFTGSGDVRRYTFEDDDRVVDGGADIGNFGRPRGMEIAPRGGRGGRGGRW